jgi:transposase-like protein
MLGFQRMKAMAKHRSHSVAFKRQVAQEFIGGETLHGLSKRHDISRQLIRIWVQKYEAGALDDDVQAADLLQEYEAKIAALEQQEPATEPRREVGSTFNLMIGRDEHNLAERARCQVFGATLAAQHRPRIWRPRDGCRRVPELRPCIVRSPFRRRTNRLRRPSVALLLERGAALNLQQSRV